MKTKEFAQREKKKFEAERAGLQAELERLGREGPREDRDRDSRDRVETRVIREFLLKYFGTDSYAIKLQILETLASVLQCDEAERGRLGLQRTALQGLLEQAQGREGVKERLYKYLLDTPEQ